MLFGRFINRYKFKQMKKKKQIMLYSIFDIGSRLSEMGYNDMSKIDKMEIEQLENNNYLLIVFEK